MRSAQIFKLISIVSCLVFSGCSIQIRNAKHLPRPLQVMQFNSAPEIGVNLTSTLYQQFKAMGVKWVKNRNAVSFNITSDQITYNNSDIVDSNTPASYTFSETTTFEIDHKGKTIYGPITLSSSTTLSMSQQSIYAGGVTGVIRQELNNNIIVLLYNALTASSTKNAISAAYEASKTP